MAILWKSEDAAKATSGRSSCKWEASGVEIDSRAVNTGDLFIAIIGDNQDGHKYVNAALQAGAAAAIVSYMPEGVAPDAPLLVVDDTMKALLDLARYARERMCGKLALITGSVGKTSSKEMLAYALERQGKTHATIGNLNNHYGLPLTLTRMPEDTEFAVLEVGMSAPNEISPLSILAKPDVSLITNVEPVHLEFFNGVEGISDAKSEVFDGLTKEGVAIINHDNPYFMRMKNAAEAKGVLNIISFGTMEDSDFCLKSYSDTDNGGNIQSLFNKMSIDYSLAIPGLHQALNSLAVLSVVNSLGANVHKAAESFINIEAKSGRGKRSVVTIDNGKVLLIDDTYNASPASVLVALDMLGDLKAVTHRRTIAVLGDMFELGDNEVHLHESLSEKILEKDIDIVFTAGQLMNNLHDKLPKSKQGGWESDSEKLASRVSKFLTDNDIILVKGSRGMRMERVVNFICSCAD